MSEKQEQRQLELDVLFKISALMVREQDHQRLMSEIIRIISVCCAAIPEHLVESELFGHEKGSFADAYNQRLGNFELTCGGSIFLDEIGDIAPNVQAKLLRLLQEKIFERVGCSDAIKADVRVIAAQADIPANGRTYSSGKHTIKRRKIVVNG